MSNTEKQPKVGMLELLDSMSNNKLTVQNGGPLHVGLTTGDANSRLTVMVGDNAGGKSLLVRYLAARLNEQDTEPLQVSMRYRTQAGMHRVFMFGDDSDESTGAVSLHAVQGALKAGKSRDSSCWVMLDEPDVGLSDSYCRALGKFLAEHANELPYENFEGFVVVTHSKTLVASILEHTTLRPHFVAVGERQVGQTLESWLADTTERTVDELLTLHDVGSKTWNAVNKILKR